MGQPWILAVDLGSGGPKVAAVALDGTLLASEHFLVPTEQTEDGGSEQDVGLWWDAIRTGVRDFIGNGVVDGADLHAVGLTSQYSSTIPVGSDGEPVGPCLMWSDHRGAPYTKQAVGGPVAGTAPDVLAQGLRYTGMIPMSSGEGPLGHELWLRHGAPEVYARTDVLLEPADYLGLRFTGRPAATPASMWVSGLVDTRPGCAPRYVPSLVRRYGHDPTRLPSLLPTGSVLGGVLPSVAADLGVRADAPVVCGVPDMHAAFVGSGATDEYQAHLAISTTSWQSCRVPFKRTNVVTYLSSVPAIDPGTYLVVNDQGSAGFCLRWWMDRIDDAAAMSGNDPLDYETVLSHAARAPMGSDGVVFVPWLRGERTPVDDRRARAGFLNVSATVDLAILTRALLEGVALNSRWLLQALESFIRRPVPSLRALGGGAQSDFWCQVYADVLDRTIERVVDPLHAQVRGAALLARVGLGEISVAEAGRLVPMDRRFEPTPGASDVYDPLFREFKKLFRSLRPHHHRLNA